MLGAEQHLLDMSVNALSTAYNELNSLKCDYAAGEVEGGKHDTYGLDYVPEDVIQRKVNQYDSNIVLITEETGKNYSGRKGLEPMQTVLISDPTDRSIKMREFLQELMKQDAGYSKREVHEAFEEYSDRWVSEHGNPTISGASGSITAIRDRKIVFNAMVNYVTGELFISDPLGNRIGRIDEYGNKDMQSLQFPSLKGDSHKYVTFLGKEGYLENLKKCKLALCEDDCVDPWTGGPLRILRLSSKDEDDVSFILNNGEKICEWIGWLSWVKYARDPVQSDEHALEAYRLFFESPRTKELVLVAPGPHYSIFDTRDGETTVDLDKMFQLRDPSHYRETIVIAPRHTFGRLSMLRSFGNLKEQLYP